METKPLITSRDFELTRSIQDHVENKINKWSKLLKKQNSKIKVQLSGTSQTEYAVRIQVYEGPHAFTVNEKGEDLLQVVGLASTHMRRQLIDFKKRRQSLRNVA